MVQVPWTQEINFASALLLHSCLTILIKESLNLIVVLDRLSRRYVILRLRSAHGASPDFWIRTSVVLDAYTSVLSHDADGELSELYFTNTGLLLLAASLAASVAMNMLLDMMVLNMIVASTFGLTFIISLFVCRNRFTLPVMALRRAGRFIWSDTPFVNFFTLIYIATVLNGKSSLRLQDYVTFRCIAMLELLFMKAKLAASNPQSQVVLMKRLLESERVVVPAYTSSYRDHELIYPSLSRNSIQAFTTFQRLSVMLLKTTIGYDLGGINGASGPSYSAIPALGQTIRPLSGDIQLYRMSEDTIIVGDSASRTQGKDAWSSFLLYTHGILLRKLGKIRVVYVLRVKDTTSQEDKYYWHSNINLVTGVTKAWLDQQFYPGIVCDSTLFF